ncbi:MAG: recombinase zinc beta ribbon domain-containing protein [Acetatifactor sp.]
MVMDKTTKSVQELSAQMGISLPKAYALVKQPGFPTIKIGTIILIPIEAYKEWLLKTSIKMPILSGIFFCADCGAKLYQVRHRGWEHDKEHFVCATYRKVKGGCSSH